MLNTFLILVTALYCVTQTECSILRDRVFINQKDYSEYCKRKVMGSIFLGRHSGSSVYKLLLLTKIDLPFNCYVIIRAEIGSDIIVVIQTTDDDLRSNCELGDQLVFYDMGETFGGYQGPLSDSMLGPYKIPPSLYTLTTTEHYADDVRDTSALYDDGSDKDHSLANTNAHVVEQTGAPPYLDNVNTFMVEVPLVNISVQGDGDFNWQDALYDATEKHTDTSRYQGTYYISTEMPLLEVFPEKKGGSRRDDNAPHYQLSFLDPPNYFTTTTSYDFMPSFKKTFGKHLFEASPIFTKNKLHLNQHFTKKTTNPFLKDSTKQFHNEEELNEMLELLKNIEVSPNHDIQRDKDSIDLENILNMEHTKSLYLVPNLKDMTSSEISSVTSTSKMTSMNEARISEENSPSSQIGHESWDNLVQAAPEMAKVLSSTTTNEESHTNKRKKRLVKVLPVEDSKPHRFSMVTPAQANVMSTLIYWKYGLEQLVEAQDDEVLSARNVLYNPKLQPRVYLRRVGRFLGPELFNLCSHQEVKQRYVLLFNSSRILLSIKNFSMPQVAIVATAARALYAGEAHCPDNYLECQVCGTRVCVSATCACDGVPNCGSHDIYDEDRIACSRRTFSQSNIYLAAFAFLIVLITCLFISHYWLKRCVPKVSQAFFVYTDGAENVLNLGTIMRSPHDDNESRMALTDVLLQSDEEFYIGDKRKTLLQEFLRKLNFFNFSTAKDEPIESARERVQSICMGDDKPCTFAEMEINKMISKMKAVDEAVQTGSSLEMETIDVNKTESLQGTTKVREAQPESELNILKAFKMKYAERVPSKVSDSIASSSIEAIDPEPLRRREEQLRSVVYEDSDLILPFTETVQTSSLNIGSQQTKRLRFEDKPVNIPSEFDMENQHEAEPSQLTERGNVDPAHDSKDFNWFWKKAKKKGHK